MKKFFAIAACAACLLAACDKLEQEKDSLPQPDYKPYHGNIFIPGGNEVSGDLPDEIELTSDGIAIIIRKNPKEGRKRYRTVRYRVNKKDDGSIEIDLGDDDGKIVVKDHGSDNPEIIFTDPENKEHKAGGKIGGGDVITGPFADNLCRSWKPSSVIVSAKGGELPASLGVAKTFDVGGDLKAVAEHLKTNGIDVDVALISQFDIDRIIFTETGKIIYIFKSSALEPYVGSYTLKDAKEDNFTYDFSMAWSENPVIPVKGGGTITITAGTMSVYTLVEITVDGVTYQVSLTIVSKEDK